MELFMIFLLTAAVVTLLLFLRRERGIRRKTELFLTEKAESEKAGHARELRQLVEAISAGLSKGEAPCGLVFIRADSGKAYCSAYAAKLLDWPSEMEGFSEESGAILERMDKLLPGTEEGSDTVELSRDGAAVWVEICRHWQDKDLMLTVKNVSDAVEAKKSALYNNRHDMLTGFFNHKTFLEKLGELFEEKDRIGFACMALFNLEALDVINGSFGFASVDEYIKAFTEALQAASPVSSLFSRRSANEFYGFFYGYPNESLLRQTVDKLWKEIGDTVVRLGDKKKEFRIRASAGITWYPRDSEKPEELLTFANFAAYIGQKKATERISEYDRERYLKDSYLLGNREAFIRLIEQRMIRYAFQPIVDVTTAKIYGYEMLMRPQVAALSNPFDVLSIARMQSKLHIIENITWFESMKTFREQVERGAIPYNTKVFLNSIGSAVLSEDELSQFYEQYFDYMKNLVIEITEREQDDDDYIAIKRRVARQWNAQIAIDDYGTGYNSEVSLLYFQPNIVKIDMTIVQGIDHDTDRQNIMKNLIQYAKLRDIRVLAEGVQTREELQKVIELGIDYVQGYYLSKPDFAPKDISPKLKLEIGKFKHG